MLGGRIVETGGPELAMELHKQGYDRIRAAHPEVQADEEPRLAKTYAATVGHAYIIAVA